MNGAIETRQAVEVRALPSGILAGYAAVFDVQSRDLGGFTESIQRGAFKRSLADSDHVLALYDHDSKSVLGRVGSGTLRLDEDDRGLRFEIDLPPTTTARDLAALVERRDVAGASFAFTVPKGGDHWRDLHGKPHRTLLDVNLHEITITSNPAYPDTSVARRHMTRYWMPLRLRNARRYLETV